jgi:predicted ferric reductase
MVVGSDSATVTWLIVQNIKYRPIKIATLTLILIPVLVITLLHYYLSTDPFYFKFLGYNLIYKVQFQWGRDFTQSSRLALGPT